MSTKTVKFVDGTAGRGAWSCGGSSAGDGVDLDAGAAGEGRQEVRIAYVLCKEDLARALVVLRKALEAYPGRTE